MAKMDIGGTIIIIIMLAVWPVMPTVLIIWGLVNANTAQKVVNSLTETTTGTITQSGTFTGGEFDEQHGDIRYLALSVWFEYEVDGTKYEGGRLAPGNKVPASARRAGLDATADKYVVGESHTAYYDPGNPSKAYLLKGSKWDHAGKMKWGIFIFLGVFGLLLMLLAVSKFAK